MIGWANVRVEEMVIKVSYSSTTILNIGLDVSPLVLRLVTLTDEVI